jgi:hypothetical protein
MNPIKGLIWKDVLIRFHRTVDDENKIVFIREHHITTWYFLFFPIFNYRIIKKPITNNNFINHM